MIREGAYVGKRGLRGLCVFLCILRVLRRLNAETAKGDAEDAEFDTVKPAPISLTFVQKRAIRVRFV